MTSTNFHSLNCTSFPSELHEEDHHQFHLKQQASPSSHSNSILFTSNQEQEGTCYQLQEGYICVSHNGSCDHPAMLQTESTNTGVKLSINLKNDDGNPSESNSIKWMSSNMKKMMDSDQKVVADQSTRSSETRKHRSKTAQIDNYKVVDLHNNDNGNNTIRVCSDCNTTKTPLWRSGPRGPKTLCNACGIRQRKARRAIGIAANGTVETPLATSMKRDHKKKHKSKRSSADESYNTLPIKKRYKLASQPSRGIKKICFEDLPIILSKNSTAYQQVFPQDDREAAILLMALSYGLVHG